MSLKNRDCKILSQCLLKFNLRHLSCLTRSFPSFKDWEGSEILSYLQANKLASYTFKSLSEIPGSETKDFATNGISRSPSCIFVFSPSCHLSLLCDAEQPSVCCVLSEFTILLRNVKLQEYSGP